MSSATRIKLRAKVEARAAQAAEDRAAQAHAAQAEYERIARTHAAQADAPTPGQGNEAPRPDLRNPYEPADSDEAPMAERHTVPLAPPVLPPPIFGGELELEIQEDHSRLGNKRLAQPAIPDFNTVLFSSETVSAFASPERHAQALGTVKELQQQKGETAKLAYAQRIEKDRHDIERVPSSLAMYQV